LSQRYIPLVTLECRHAYYRDGVLPGFQLIPSRATAQLIRNYRLLLKHDHLGLRLLQECRVNEGVTEPLIALGHPLELLFGFKANDASFQVKTGTEFFSSNRQKLVIDLREENAEMRLLPLASGSVSFEGEAPLQLIDAAGTVIAESKAPRASFPLANLTENIYASRAGGEVKSAFLHLQHDAEFDGVFLMRAIQSEKKYAFRFPARKIHWQYTILQQYNSYTDLALIDETDQLHFERAAHPSVDKAFSFVTTEPVLLSETYEYRLQIEDQGRVVKKKLPFANLNNCGKCLQNVENICLENYVSV